ncbi:MAG: succinylglutamate desuccinylase/aspartoacylase family protein [Flavobacteriales bacterium]
MNYSNNPIVISGITINAGESKQINAQIARLPSRTRIDTPIYVCRAIEPGPTVLISGGLHGDEINGIEIVRGILKGGYNKPLIGTTICIPIINIFGFLNLSRNLTDGKDINRSFPGNPDGSLASQVAHYITKNILPIIDYGLDFHTGGGKIDNFPQLRAVLDDEKNMELAMAFAAPMIINSPFREKSLRKEADKIGKRILVFEAGESLRLNPYYVQEGVDGTCRLLKHLGLLSEAPEATIPPTLIRKSSWLRSHSSGLFHRDIKNGQYLRKNDIIGKITDPFGTYEEPLSIRHEGHVIAVNYNPVVTKGDALIHVGH